MGEAIRRAHGQHPSGRGRAWAAEIRTRYDGSWARGFEVVGLGPAGFIVRRVSDGAILPREFHEEEVRRYS